MSSDSFFGLLLYANGFEVGAKVQGLLFDGFPADQKPDDVMLVGGHAGYLFRLTESADLSIGGDARQGIDLSGDVRYRQYLDVGLRVGFNYNLGRHFVLSAVLYPFWVSVRETDVADSYSLWATIPSAAVAAGFLF
jgi:hypothetical protein